MDLKMIIEIIEIIEMVYIIEIENLYLKPFTQLSLTL